MQTIRKSRKWKERRKSISLRRLSLLSTPTSYPFNSARATVRTEIINPPSHAHLNAEISSRRTGGRKKSNRPLAPPTKITSKHQKWNRAQQRIDQREFRIGYEKKTMRSQHGAASRRQRLQQNEKAKRKSKRERERAKERETYFSPWLPRTDRSARGWRCEEEEEDENRRNPSGDALYRSVRVDLDAHLWWAHGSRSSRFLEPKAGLNRPPLSGPILTRGSD